MNSSLQSSTRTHRFTRSRRAAGATFVAAILAAASQSVQAGAAPAATQAQYANATIADLGLAQIGRYGGQCYMFADALIRSASNGQEFTSGSTYRDNYAKFGVEVSRDQAAKGDIIQLFKPADERTFYAGMHTAIVLNHQVGSNSFDVVDSNYGWTEMVSRHSYDPYASAARSGLVAQSGVWEA
jgi:hypothetical protein